MCPDGCYCICVSARVNARYSSDKWETLSMQWLVGSWYHVVLKQNNCLLGQVIHAMYSSVLSVDAMLKKGKKMRNWRKWCKEEKGGMMQRGCKTGKEKEEIGLLDRVTATEHHSLTEAHVQPLANLTSCRYAMLNSHLTPRLLLVLWLYTHVHTEACTPLQGCFWQGKMKIPLY